MYADVTCPPTICTQPTTVQSSNAKWDSTHFYLLKFIILIITTVIYKFETRENFYEESSNEAELVIKDG